VRPVAVIKIGPGRLITLLLFALPRRRPGPRRAGFGSRAQRLAPIVPRLGPGLRRGSANVGKRTTIVSPTLPVDAVRGLGNALRHDYDRVDLRTIYVTATESLPSLRADCVAALE